MSAFLLRPMPLISSQFTYTQLEAAGFPAANLADPQPKIVYRMGVGATPYAARLDVDLLTDTEIDTAAILYHNARSPTALWRMLVRTAAQGPFPAPPAGEFDATIAFLSAMWSEPALPGSRVHGLWAGAAPVNGRYVRFVFQSTDSGNPDWQAGVLALGRRFQPGASIGLPGVDWGLGRRPGDLSDVQVLSGGERAIWRRARVPEVRWSWSHLSDAELRTLWSILLDAGESAPLLFVEDAASTAGLQERIHYGTLSAVDFYERRMPEKSRIDLRLRHWL